MRFVHGFILGGIVAAGVAGAASAQSTVPAASAASAPTPAGAASRAMPARNPAITAAENAKEPGVQRPEERVIPQISVPLKSRNSTLPALSASAPAGSRPGTVNDDAARCLARSGAEKAACERALAASAPVKAAR
ncbi:MULTISPECIES: hypothetical protein [Roseateles]|uniref:Uncharacterized protein n=1 Tax=Pelomonas aquatica TaxID=431058 RepID=A0ABU1ZEF1_9BURK|nr:MULTISPECIES: hypothetical protein [Roseateles]KQY85431.1 hypothetical protein ASD35_22710 [Pelomonas sp. Root1444]MDR7299006.1 hypothetical protein [Pelomonas aquatica]